MKYLVELGYCKAEYEDAEYIVLVRDLVEALSVEDAEAYYESTKELLEYHGRFIEDSYAYNHTFLNVYEYEETPLTSEEIVKRFLEEILDKQAFNYLEQRGVLTTDFLLPEI